MGAPTRNTFLHVFSSSLFFLVSVSVAHSTASEVVITNTEESWSSLLKILSYSKCKAKV